MNIPFTKMHGCGNDYIYINCFDHTIENPEDLSRTISNRHFGIGGDGIVLICHSDVADAKMRMFNIDGSEGKMCGNAIRCVAKYLYDHNIACKETLEIDTLSGVKIIKLHTENGKMLSATVDIGEPMLDPAIIPTLIEEQNALINFPFQVDDEIFAITTVSMGNPHCVLFCDDIDSINLQHIGPKFEHHPMFPESVNTEFIQIESRNCIRMRVWERGSGETLACGTGACAAVVAAVLNGHCDKDTDVIVKLLGGELIIRYTDESVLMTGPAVQVFEGEIQWNNK
ncbi:diaminopimelate epimerase [Psychrobacillus vulpis]|uniref:Diaminopimelate epimerase n=1 Tax=Psychrobacillus vulpis TaxID=2325572 RepID=A0A544TPL5_9BACI|nr:diaminopimelate epimerase [Psychrobacillus vulpis]